MNHLTTPLTFASLFSGGGLADIGATQAGYELLWGIELEPDIAAVANYNLKHRDKVYAASVIGFDWSSVERPDHLHMSPPCQDFSVAKTTGKKANPNDDIADACIEAIKALQPSSVTLENVEGYRKAKGFQKIVDALWGLGYWVNVDVLNSADFGVPQTRRRLILRAVLGGFPAPLPPKEPWRGWYEAIEDLIPTLPESQFAEWQLKRLPDELKTHLCHGTERQGPNYVAPVRRNQQDPSWTLKASDYKGIPKAYIVDGKTNGNGDRAHLVPGGNASSFSVRDGGEPSRTVESTERVGNIPRASLGGRVVRMTPRALARFQTVPDWYELPEKTSLACKIIGNGVPCLMMQEILKTL